MTQQQETWRLSRTRQCAHCPWRKDVDPFTIPNGYSVEKHRNLAGTIAPTDIMQQVEALASATEPQEVMACHETHDSHCIGYLANQLGPGNNLRLRVQMRNCENAHLIETVGEQHETFEDTLPSMPEALPNE